MTQAGYEATRSAIEAVWRIESPRLIAGLARITGDVGAAETRGSIIVADDGRLVATLGVEDLVIVQSGGATLVARKDQLDQLKALVEGLDRSGHGSYL